MIRDRLLEDRFEIRLQGVQDLDDINRYDLAWLPAPFIPPAAFNAGLANIRSALRPERPPIDGWRRLYQGLRTRRRSRGQLES